MTISPAVENGMPGNKYIIWKDEYLVGDYELDRHHRQMFGIINELYDAMISKAPNSRMLSLFQSITEYGDFHFEAEENRLKKAHYPELAGQEKAHHLYKKRLKELIDGSAAAPDIVAPDVLRFLRNWWLNHILELDKSYAPYLNQ